MGTLAPPSPGQNEAESESAESAHRVAGRLERDGHVKAGEDAESGETAVAERDGHGMVARLVRRSVRGIGIGGTCNAGAFTVYRLRLILN